MNKEQKKIMTGLIAAVGLGIIILGVNFLPSWTASSITRKSVSEMNSVAEPEIFTVQPIVETIASEEFQLDTTSSFAAISQRPASESEIASFIVPFAREAFAISPTNNQVVLTEWTSPSAGAGIISTAYDSTSNILWFPEPGVGKIAKLDPSSNTITEYTMPTGTPVSFPVTVDLSTGNVYFIESQANNFNRIARLNPSTGGITEWFMSCCGNGFSWDRITFDGGNLWLSTSNRDNSLIRLNPTTNVETKWLVVPTSNFQSNLNAIPKADASGNIWHVQEDSNTINRLNPSNNQITKWPIPQPGSNPIFVALDPTNSNNVYFTEANGNRIGKLEISTNQITQWIIPTASSTPDTLIVDGQGVVYFREFNSNKIGRLVASTNTITEWSIAGARAGWFSLDGSQNLFFSEEGNGIKIGRLS